MLNKNDPLIGAVQEVMKKNQAERNAAKLVNEKFGVHDRKALPHEKQSEWDAAYKAVLTEGLHPNQQKLDVHEPEKDKLTAQDFKMLRAKKSMEEMMNPTSAPTSQTPANVVRKAAVKQNVRMGGNPTGAASSQTPASTVRKAAVRQNVRMGGNPTGSPVRPSSSKGPMEEDVTSPSSMGISKPDYAPAGTKPDYAVRKTVGPKSDLIKKPTMSSGNSTVTQTGKTSSSATKSTMKESNLQEKAVSKAQHRFFGLVRGIQKGKAHGSAKAEKAAREMSAKSVRDYAKTSERGLPEKVSEAMNQPQIRGQSNVAGARLSGSFTTQGALSRPPRPAIDSAPRPQQASPMMGQGAPGIKRQPGGARPSVVAKNTATGTQASTGYSIGGARPALVAKNTPTASKSADRPNDLGKAGVPGTGGRLAPAAPAAPAAKPVQAAKKPAAAAPVKNASTRGGTMSQSDANVLAKVRASGGQKLSKTLPSGRERLKFFAARNAERRGP